MSECASPLQQHWMYSAALSLCSRNRYWRRHFWIFFAAAAMRLERSVSSTTIWPARRNTFVRPTYTGKGVEEGRGEAGQREVKVQREVRKVDNGKAMSATVC